ncbi:hypothetical protein CAPTEDRAFT_226035 [Capitella teleta]|uniref:Di-N-acetylchitobiase n=1 Tax=Capitella teleta TaxID=283909 RepID=R7TUI7_CAPTE|nr:hypothetical protein CAPTEDRAFT_226035 [Capitella teleta]|eukprot:ELT97583.1 hypothetical protein CAPTEDRAFT_226035 [Capitella teleta]
MTPILYRLSTGLVWIQRDCPCKDASLCRPVNATVEKEVFIFSLKKENWRSYDWDCVTTIVAAGYLDDELMCFAHSKQARVVFIANFPVQNLTSEAARHQWVAEKVQYAKENFLDGINVDFESDIPGNKPAEKKGLTQLIQELAESFRKTFVKPQVSIDVAWSPECIDLRCYDYAALVDAADLSFVMAYDERSQVFDECIAWANSASNNTYHGLVNYLKLGVPSHKLILGLPWYGYDYPCIKYSKDNKCDIKKTPFRGVECSDAAGTQIGYTYIMGRLDASFSGRLWDEDALSPYFSYKNDKGEIHQVWYDDSMSLSLKIHMVDTHKLAGTGMWEADDVDYTDTPRAKQQRDSMWATFPKRKLL